LCLQRCSTIIQPSVAVNLLCILPLPSFCHKCVVSALDAKSLVLLCRDSKSLSQRTADQSACFRISINYSQKSWQTEYMQPSKKANERPSGLPFKSKHYRSFASIKPTKGKGKWIPHTHFASFCWLRESIWLGWNKCSNERSQRTASTPYNTQWLGQSETRLSPASHL